MSFSSLFGILYKPLVIIWRKTQSINYLLIDDLPTKNKFDGHLTAFTKLEGRMGRNCISCQVNVELIGQDERDKDSNFLLFGKGQSACGH